MSGRKRVPIEGGGCNLYGKDPNLRSPTCIECPIYDSCLAEYQDIQGKEKRALNGFHWVSSDEQEVLMNSSI